MTTVINTVITIDLKEYARLQAIEQAARAVLAYSRTDHFDCFQENRPHCEFVKLEKLLDGEK